MARRLILSRSGRSTFTMVRVTAWSVVHSRTLVVPFTRWPAMLRAPARRRRLCRLLLLTTPRCRHCGHRSSCRVRRTSQLRLAARFRPLFPQLLARRLRLWPVMATCLRSLALLLLIRRLVTRVTCSCVSRTQVRVLLMPRRGQPLKSLSTRPLVRGLRSSRPSPTPRRPCQLLRSRLLPRLLAVRL